MEAKPIDVSRRLDMLLADPRLSHSAAAFDADGTIWQGDVGELLLKAMIGMGRAPFDAWSRYEQMLTTNAPEACAYCVELLAGTDVDTLVRWNKELVQAGLHRPIFTKVFELARALEARGCEVWVVSGSNHWTVSEVIESIGLDSRRVLALKSEVARDVLTGKVVAPITCAMGKVKALRSQTERPLIFAAGNALYDLDLLMHAEMQLVVAPKNQSTPLRLIAEQRHWLVLEVDQT